MFALPAVQAVINFKWTSWARQFLLYELACYSLWLGLFTAFTLLFQVEDWTMPLWQAIQDRCVHVSRKAGCAGLCDRVWHMCMVGRGAVTVQREAAPGKWCWA